MRAHLHPGIEIEIEIGVSSPSVRLVFNVESYCVCSFVRTRAGPPMAFQAADESLRGSVDILIE